MELTILTILLTLFEYTTYFSVWKYQSNFIVLWQIIILPYRINNIDDIANMI